MEGKLNPTRTCTYVKIHTDTHLVNSCSNYPYLIDESNLHFLRTKVNCTFPPYRRRIFPPLTISNGKMRELGGDLDPLYTGGRHPAHAWLEEVLGMVEQRGRELVCKDLISQNLLVKLLLLCSSIALSVDGRRTNKMGKRPRFKPMSSSANLQQAAHS